jgi:trehalose 6-phosphate synthase/phosphatase
MDTFSEPYTRQGDDVSIDKVREQIRQLEEENIRKGIPLSGRIIHVCHYLPITATLLRPNGGVLSPPATPPSMPEEVSPLESDQTPPQSEPPVEKSPTVWSLSPRYGHAAMISGIRSLSQTHEQLIVGWTGDVQSPNGTDKIPFDTISQQERNDFGSALQDYQRKESDPDDDNDSKTNYVPVWLEDHVAHGHYDGYCKQSA